MNYIETELVFSLDERQENMLVKGAGQSAPKGKSGSLEILGIKIRLGDQPLVYNLSKLCGAANGSAMQAIQGNKEHYLIVHAISATRTQGNARVDELQYIATAIHPGNLQTVDLVPKTRFNEVAAAGLNFTGALDLSGQLFPDIPEALIGHLLSELVDLAPGIQLQLSASARFIGKLSYSVRIPVVQASGIGSGTCCWILRPNEKNTPLLGDQLLVQSIAVPIGTRTLEYSISGRVKADKGLFWKQQQKETPEYKVIIDLGSNPSV